MTKLTGSEREFYRRFSKQGQGDAVVEITPQEAALLTAITHLDLHDGDAPGWLDQDLRPRGLALALLFGGSLEGDDFRDEDAVRHVVSLVTVGCDVPELLASLGVVECRDPSNRSFAVVAPKVTGSLRFLRRGVL